MQFGGLMDDPLLYQQDRNRPGLLQGGSLALPVPGGLDYSDPGALSPTYLGPAGMGQGTAPWVPYTPPEVNNVGLMSFDELDHGMYRGLLERTHPERLENPYAGWGQNSFPADPNNPLAPPSSGLPPGGGLSPPSSPTPTGGGAASRTWNDNDLDALLMELKRNPANMASGIVKDYATSHDIGDWKGFRDAAYSYVTNHGSALGDLFEEEGLRGGNR